MAAKPEEPWIEDGDEGLEKDLADKSCFSTDLFAPSLRPELLHFPTANITLSLHAIRTKHPTQLQSTGLTLWSTSKQLCEYLLAYPELVRNRHLIELGAGLGAVGIVANKLGARRVVLTDGDTDTLDNMRRNVASNCTAEGVVCQQLLWGRNVEQFREQHAPSQGFDIVVGSDIFYAQDSLLPLFQTILALLSPFPNSIFLLGYSSRGVTIETVLSSALHHGLTGTAVDVNQHKEGIYSFRRS